MPKSSCWSNNMVAVVMTGVFLLLLSPAVQARFEDSFGNGADGNLVVEEGGILIMNPTATYVIGENPARGRTIQVHNTTGFRVGDEVLIISMIDITTEEESLNDAGRYETNRIAQVDPQLLTLVEPLEQNFSTALSGDGIHLTKVHQVLKIPNYKNMTLTGKIQCSPWNGLTGGIVCFRASGHADFSSTSMINVSYLGYRGATGGQGSSNGYVGESWCLHVDQVESQWAIGSGGGGGIYVSKTNYGPGGSGGHINHGMPDPPWRPEGGEGGDPVGVAEMQRIFLGAGGGAGASWNSGALNHAGNGGGIIMMSANKISFAAGASILSEGRDGDGGDPPYRATCGGGAGGSIYMAANRFDGVQNAHMSVLGAFQAYVTSYKAGDGRKRLITVPPSDELDLQPVLAGVLDNLRYPGLYSGGSSFAQPFAVDLDDDDDVDVLIGEEDGTLTYWENVGSPQVSEWTNPVRNYAGIDVGDYAAPALGDLNGDGMLELVIGCQQGTLYYYSNNGSLREPAWLLDSSSYAGVAVEGYSVPTLGDLDNDGDQDLVVGQQTRGTLNYYQNLGSSWAPPEEGYAEVNVIANSAPVLYDWDGDGDLDLIVGSAMGGLAYKENQGNRTAPDWETDQIDQWQSIQTPPWSTPTVADLNADRQPDLLIGNLNGGVLSYLSSQLGLEARSGNFEFLDAGEYSAPAAGDLDGDSDQDLLIGTRDGKLNYYENVGTVLSPRWAAADSGYAGIDVGTYAAPCLYDLNGDGLLDLVVGEQNGNLNYYENTGTAQSPVFTFVTASLAGVDVPLYSAPLVLDADADGDGDLLVGQLDGTVTFCENTTIGSDITWGAPQNSYFGIDVGERSCLGAGYLNQDDAIDLLVGAENGTLVLYSNRGTAATPEWSHPRFLRENIDVGLNAAPTLADLDGDGDVDLLVGEKQGGLNFWRNMNAHLRLFPSTITLEQGESCQFSVASASGPVQWSILRNQSGAVTLSATGYYTAGATGGPMIYDVIEVRDASGVFARAHINVIRYEDFMNSGKAIVCAGRKDQNDSVWPATNYLTQLAYRTLLSKGYSKDRIRFLSPETDLDVDENGLLDDIDAESTLSNLESALAWAAGAQDLVIYLADHGWRDGPEGCFRINQGDENILTASHLDSLLDGLQQTSDLRINLIIDACNSGTFIPALIPPPGKQRINITSCGSDQLTYFLVQGLVSFSEAFWNSISSGSNVGEAFDLARAAMSRFQDCQLDDDGDGFFQPHRDGVLAKNTDLGISSIAGTGRPQIGNIMSNQNITGVTSTTLWAKGISSTFPIERVWAVIVPPEWQTDPNSSEPILNIATQELQYDSSGDIWKGVWGGFIEPGTYKVIIYARDIWQTVSLPKQVYVHRSDFQEKAIIVVGDGDYGPGQPWENANLLGQYAYRTLLRRWFGKNDVFYFCPLVNQDVDGNGLYDDIDGAPSLAALQTAIETNCVGANKVTIYMVGQSATGTFQLNGSEILTAMQMDTWLDNLQTSSQTEVYSILEFQHSGGFADTLVPPANKKRITITSALENQQSYCFANGIFSFSQFFWGQIYEGANIRDAFMSGVPVIRYLSRYRQHPGLTDNGNGILNEKQDGLLARVRYIGAGFVTGGDDLPVIGQVAGDVFLTTGTTTAKLWCADVFDSDGIAAVTAKLVPPTWPDSSVVSLPLVYQQTSNRYETTYSDFNEAGDYRILYTAEDLEGNLSAEKVGVVYQYTTADSYEIDDSTAEASLCVVDLPAQQHNFHDQGDQDWLWFQGIAGATYTVRAENVAAECDPTLVLYATADYSAPLWVEDFGLPGEAKERTWECPETGVYYLQVYNASSAVYGPEISYEVKVIRGFGLSNLNAEALSASEISLSWTPSSATDVASFVVKRSLQSNMRTNNMPEVAVVQMPEHQLVDIGLLPNTTYHYWVLEYDSNARLIDDKGGVFATTLDSPTVTPTPTATETPMFTPTSTSTPLPTPTPLIEENTESVSALEGGLVIVGPHGYYTNTQLQIPAGALASDQSITLREPSSAVGVQHAVEVLPVPGMLAGYGTLRIELAPEDVPTGVATTDLRCFHYDGGIWEMLPLPEQHSVVPLAGDRMLVTAPVLELGGVYAVFASNNDTDGDGVPDVVENAGPNSGDGNGDGTPDSQQVHVCSLPNAKDGRYVTLLAPTGTAFEKVVASADLPAPKEGNNNFVLGLFGFEVSNVTPSETILVEMLLPDNLKCDAYYRYGPTPEDSTPHWYLFGMESGTGSMISPGKIELYYQDGLRGDDDLTENGRIVDPGGAILHSSKVEYWQFYR